MGDIALALFSGAVGAFLAQGVAVWNARQLENKRQAFQIRQMKLDVLRQFAGNRAAATNEPLKEHESPFYEALNGIMVAFSDSPDVVAALDVFRQSRGTDAHGDNLTKLFKAMCADVGVDLSAFNDTLFLTPFKPGRGNPAAP